MALYSTIISDSKYNSNIATDIDNLRSRYKESSTILKTVDSKELMDIDVKYPSFEVYAYEQNRFRLLVDSSSVKFIPRWELKPDYASFDIYGTVIYWNLLLFLNNIDCIEEFTNLEELIVPTIGSINSMVKDRLPQTEYEKVESASEKNPAKSFLYKAFLFPNYKSLKAEAQGLLEGSAEKTSTISVINNNRSDSFTLTNDILRIKKVFLTYSVSAPSSINFYYDNFKLPLRYGYDYILLDDKKISWSPSDSSILSNSILNAPTVISGKTIKIDYISVETQNLLQGT